MAGESPWGPLSFVILFFIRGKKYHIINYQEYPGSIYSENEFHEKEQDWFTDIIVQ